MKKYFVTILFLSFLLGFNSCSNNNIIDPLATIQQGMIPLKVGFNWTWNVTLFDQNGKVLESHLWYVEIVKDTMINNEKWFLEKEGNTLSAYPITNRDGVTYSYSNGHPSIIFNTIIEDTTLPSTNSNGSYLVSKNILIHVPYGNFTCNNYRVYLDFNDKKILVQNYYLEFNKGIIKTESFSYKSGGGQYISAITELVSTNVF